MESEKGLSGSSEAIYGKSDLLSIFLASNPDSIGSMIRI
jgi:hypothetical protein